MSTLYLRWKKEDLSIHYRVSGKGPAVLLLPSWGIPLWSGLETPLVSAGYQVLSVTFPGHGTSIGPSREYTLGDLASWTWSVVEAARLGNVHIVGLGLGGMVALRLAMGHQQRVESLFLIGASAQSEPRLFLQRNKGILRRLQTAHCLSEEKRRDLARYLLSFLFAREDPSLQTWEQHLVSSLTHKQMCYGLHLSASSMFSRKEIGEKALRGIVVPSFVARGAEDVFRTVEESDYLYLKLGNCLGMASWLNLGHLCLLEEPEMVFGQVLDFLKEAEKTQIWVPIA